MSGENFTKRGLWPWRIICYLILAVGVGACVVGVERLAQRLRQTLVREDLAEMQEMLAVFHGRHRGWPRVSTPAQLLLVFRGKLDAEGHPIDSTWLLTGRKLYFKNSAPLADNGAIVDPWGNPYIYRYYPPEDGAPESYVLFSAGPDGRHSSPLGWPIGANGLEPEDEDNICVFSPQIRRN